MLDLGHDPPGSAPKAQAVGPGHHPFARHLRQPDDRADPDLGAGAVQPEHRESHARSLRKRELRRQSMADLQLAVFEKGARRTFNKLRDNFSVSHSDSAHLGPFSVSYSVGIKLK